MAVKRVAEKLQAPMDEQRRRLNEFVAMSLELDGVDMRVFLYLSGRLNFEDTVHVPQLELATVLGRRKEHISRSIRSLVKAGILLPGSKGTRASEWRLNPDFGK